MVGAVVGTILNAINQGDAFLVGDQLEWLKGVLTYCVPFSVSTFASWCAILENTAADHAAVGSEPS